MSHTITTTLEGHGFRNLLIFLLIYIVGSPFLDPYPSLEILANLFLTLTLFLSVYTVRRQRRRRSLAITILLILQLFFWLGAYDLIPLSREAAYLLFLIYFGLLIYSYTKELARFRKITVNVLLAALCLYLIIGLFWGAFYTLLNVLVPGSYAGTLLDKAPVSSQLHIFNYFSMVTLTTLGYGDITPQTPGAGALCQMEAIIGQFFTAVIVAWLVGNIAARSNRAGGND